MSGVEAASGFRGREDSPDATGRLDDILRGLASLDAGGFYILVGRRSQARDASSVARAPP
jgi:hypothetical protein